MNLPQQANRRTVLKTIGAGMVGGTVFTGSASAKPFRTPPWWTATWGSDGSDDWEITDVTGNVPREKTKPYFLIAPTYLSCSPHFITFDQVVDTPPKNHGRYNVNWHVHQVRYDNPESEHDGSFYNGKEVLTSDPFTGFPITTEEVTRNDGMYLNTVSKIMDADESGHANVVKGTFTFTCPVRPRHGGDCPSNLPPEGDS